VEKASVVATRQLSDGGKAQRVYLLLSNEILRGGYAPGDVLPGEIKPRCTACPVSPSGAR
jgi:DNA-binding GntR family transcriptional regulator